MYSYIYIVAVIVIICIYIQRYIIYGHTYIHNICTYVNCVGIHVRFSHEEYRVKESDGHVVIKVIVSGHRNFPLQVVAISFVPTKFNLPAGQLNKINNDYVCILYLQFIQ